MKMKNKRGTIIHGIAVSEVMDSSAEKINVEKMDISSLGSDDSVFNWEHKSKENPVQVVGKVTFAKKIMKKSDCSNKHELYFWDKVKVPYIYAKGELFDAVGHAGAKDVAAILRYDNRHHGAKSRSLIAWSIEGGTMKRDGVNILDSLARDICCTIKPCNKTAHCEILEDAEGESLFKSESIENVYVEDLLKREEIDIQELKKEDQMYPSPKPPPMTKEQARAKFGSVTVLDKKPKQAPRNETMDLNKKPGGEFGNVKKIDEKGNKLPNKEIKNIRSGAPKWDQLDKKPANTPVPNKKEATQPAFHETMSQKHQGFIPAGHADRSKMVQHITNTHKAGKVNEARRLFNRFIADKGNWTKVNENLSKMKKSESEHKYSLTKIKKGKYSVHVDTPEGRHLLNMTRNKEDSGWKVTHDIPYGAGHSKHDKNKTLRNKAFEMADEHHTSLKKTMTAGSGAVAPSQLTGGAALAKECIDPEMHVLSKDKCVNKLGKKPKKTMCSVTADGLEKTDIPTIAKDKVKAVSAKEKEEVRKALKGTTKLPKKVKVSTKELDKKLNKMEEAYKTWPDREKFLEFFSTRMPSLNKKEVESIAKLVALKTFEKNEKILENMVKPKTDNTGKE
jgi:hypothetical protein